MDFLIKKYSLINFTNIYSTFHSNFMCFESTFLISLTGKISKLSYLEVKNPKTVYHNFPI